MQQNKDIFFLTGDLGFGLANDIIKDFPKRSYNCGAAEQALIDIGIGLALEDKIPFCYSITPFLVYRPFESLRTYINHEQINVKLIGSGRDDDYKHDGFSHDASDVTKILDTLPDIEQYYPRTEKEIPIIVDNMLITDKPQFLSLSR